MVFYKQHFYKQHHQHASIDNLPYIGYLYGLSWYPFHKFLKIPNPLLLRGFTLWILHMIPRSTPNGEMDKGYIWVWLTIQTNRKQNASNREDLKQQAISMIKLVWL